MAARKNFTPEHRSAQSALIRLHRPWEQSTGPRTAAGKAVSARNARLQGVRAEVSMIKLQAAANMRELRHLARMLQRAGAARERPSDKPLAASMWRDAEQQGHGAAATYLRMLRG